MLKRGRFMLLLALVFVGALFGARALRRTPPEALFGLWTEREVAGPSDEMRFYYFHKGGKGLYRYGQAAHNQTSSFDWKLDGDKLDLYFRKTGEKAVTRFVLGGEKDKRTLTLVDDPRGAPNTRYRYKPTLLDAETFGPLSLLDARATDESNAIVGRMWIDMKHYATGGRGFVMYQLSEHTAAPGWYYGFYHRGDFDDWTTENLFYEPLPSALRLHFILRGDELVSPIELGNDRDARTLSITRDPRNFLARTRLRDAGRSF